MRRHGALSIVFFGSARAQSSAFWACSFSFRMRAFRPRAVTTGSPLPLSPLFVHSHQKAYFKSAMSTPTSMTMASPLHTAQSSGFMPSMSPGTVYSTAHAVWTPQELQLLQKGLGEFPDQQYDNVTRYIKIAATIPGKCVRDVAFKVKTLATDQIPERDHNFAKRMRIDHTAEMTKMPTDDMLDDDQLNDLLQDNVLALNTMRTNLLNGKGGENKDMMIQFRDNCQTLMSAIGDICGTLPPLPVKPDTSLIPGDISSGLQN